MTIKEARKIVEELYPKVKNCNMVFDPLPEVYTRLARIRKEQGKSGDAIYGFEVIE